MSNPNRTLQQTQHRTTRPTSWADLGIFLPAGASGTRREACPRCDKGRHDTALSLDLDHGMWNCFRCNWSGRLGHAQTAPPPPPRPTLKPQDETDWKRKSIIRVWNSSQPITPGTPVAHYLQRRRLWTDDDPATLPGTLRHVPRLAYRHDGDTYTHHPALIALVQRLDGLVVTCHRTYITPDGHKADVPSVKRLMPTPTTVKGAAVRLGEAGETLAITEGIETALAVRAMLGVSTWAAVSATGMQTVQLPDTVGLVLICADHDTAGLDAGHTLTQRMLVEGRRVKLLVPPCEGQDWADVLAEKGGAE